MAERLDQIIRLLETRLDNLPEPTRRVNTDSGFVHKTPAREACSDCLANDRPMFGCETCGGRGYVEVKRTRDPYSEQKVQPYGLDGVYLERVKWRDRAIDRMAAQLAAPPKTEAESIEDANKRGYAWEEARAGMRRLYDYDVLERALELLREVDPEAHLALDTLYTQRRLAPDEERCA